MVELVSLKAKKFKCWDKLNIDFTTLPNLTLLAGPNGSGKSTVLDAIFAALYNRTPRDGSRAIEGSVKLVLQDEAHTYTIERSRTKSKSSAKLSIDGEVRSTASAEIVSFVESLIGDYDLFCTVNIIPQGKYPAFFTMEPVNQRKFLQDILGLSRFETAHQNYRQLMQTTEARAEQQRHIVNNLEQALNALQENLASEEEIEAIKTKIAQLETSIANLQDQARLAERIKTRDRLKEEIAKLRDTLDNVNLAQLRADRDQTANHIDWIKSERARYDSWLQRYTKLQHEWQELSKIWQDIATAESITLPCGPAEYEVCPLAANQRALIGRKQQVVDSMNELQVQWQELSDEFQARNYQKLQGEISALDNYEQKLRNLSVQLATYEPQYQRLSELEQQLAEYQDVPDVLEDSNVEANIAQLSEALAAEHARLANLTANTDQYVELEKQLQEAKAELNELTRSAERYQRLALLTHNYDGLPRALAHYLLPQLSQFINEFMDKNLQVELSMDDRKECVAIKRGSTPLRFSSLSGGEKFLVYFAFIMGLRRFRGAPLQFLALDEGFGALDEANLNLVAHSLQDFSEVMGIKMLVLSHLNPLRERFFTLDITQL